MLSAIIAYGHQIDIEDKNLIDSLVKPYSPDSGKHADVILVCGGDNAMLKALRDYSHLHVPFFGLNFGSVGFLLNDFNKETITPEILENSFISSNTVRTYPLNVNVEFHRSDVTKRIIAFNDFWISASNGQSIRMSMKINERRIKNDIVGDGMIFSTPIGSTGYCRAAGGTVLKPSMFLIQGVPKCCTISERREIMRPFLEQGKSKITLDFRDNIYRPFDAFYDGMILDVNKKQQIKRIEISTSTKHADIKFDSGISFYDKVYNIEHGGIE